MLASDNISNSNKYKRDKTVAKNALAHAHFRCEIDPSHKTFIRKNPDIPYTESHHLIPMQYSDQFDFSLDTKLILSRSAVTAIIRSIMERMRNH